MVGAVPWESWDQAWSSAVNMNQSDRLVDLAPNEYFTDCHPSQPDMKRLIYAEAKERGYVLD